jgi:hypothetical protein
LPLKPHEDMLGISARVFVESDALGLEGRGAVARSGPELPARGSDFIDWALPLSDVPGHKAFAETACAPVRVLERRGGLAHVAQDVDGFHVEGWATTPPQRRGDRPCEPRVVEARRVSEDSDLVPLPPGYVPFVPDAVADAQLAALFRRGGALYWLVDDEAQFTCVQWRIAPQPSAPEAGPGVRAELQRFVDQGGRRETVAFGALYAPLRGRRPAELSLTGPYETGPNGGVALCGAGYSVADVRGDVATLLRGSYLAGLFGYRPEDADLWYLTRDACEAAVREVVQRPALADTGRVHRGCG